jgi:hypothetical protein
MFDEGKLLRLKERKGKKKVFMNTSITNNYRLQIDNGI